MTRMAGNTLHVMFLESNRMRSIDRKEGKVKGCFVLIYRLLIVIITDQSKGRFLTSSTKKNYNEIGLLKCLFKMPF